MKKLFLLLLPVLFLSACVSIKRPAMLDKSFPTAEKYKILGGASVRGSICGVFGLVWFGGVDWSDLLDEAVRIYGPVDDVVSVSLDTKTTTLLGIVTLQEMNMYGTAIRYVKDFTATAPEAP
jgi:hypothetical protein